MLKQNKSIILNHFTNPKLSSKFIRKNNNINKNKISITNIALDEKKIQSVYLNKVKKRINSVGKITNYDYNNYFVKNLSFLFFPKNRELKSYFDKRNDNIISNISMNYKSKNSNSKKLTTNYSSKLKYNKDKKFEINTTITGVKRKKIINKSLSLSNFNFTKYKFL